MKWILIMAAATACICTAGCSQEKSKADRGEASEMFESICKLTKEYTQCLESAPDSADWATLCAEFEDKLDKINFNYPPDTDLLLTEGQNDTIHALMQEYVAIRKKRIQGILNPLVEVDTLSILDSIHEAETTTTVRTD